MFAQAPSGMCHLADYFCLPVCDLHTQQAHKYFSELRLKLQYDTTVSFIFPFHMIDLTVIWTTKTQRNDLN